MLEIVLYGPQQLSTATEVVFTVWAFMCSAALVLLAKAWRPTKEKVSHEENSYGRFEREVLRAETTTQRSRYVKVALAWILTGIPLTWTAMHSVKVYTVMEVARNSDTIVGFILNIYGYMPSVVIACCLALVVRVNLTPSTFRKRFMFGENKGNYVLTNPDHRRFGTARHEPKYAGN